MELATPIFSTPAARCPVAPPAAGNGARFTNIMVSLSPDRFRGTGVGRPLLTGTVYFWQKYQSNFVAGAVLGLGEIGFKFFSASKPGTFVPLASSWSSSARNSAA